MNTQSRCRGFSLVELMVAITIALILLAGIIQLFTSNRQAFRIQEGLNVLNENARFAMSRLQYDLRMAEHWHGAAELNTGGAPAIGGNNNCSDLVISDLGLEGIQGGAYNTLPAAVRDCIPISDYVPNSDLFIVRYLSERGSAGPDCLPSTIAVRADVGFDATFVNDDCFSEPDPGNANFRGYIRPYHFALYYVRPCSNPDIACDNPDADNTPSLARVPLRDGAVPHISDAGDEDNAEIVVEGVEQMKLLYGLDLNGNRNADTFRTAANIAGNDWSRVISTRVDLLIRSTVLDLSRDVSAASNTYTLLGGTSAVFTHTVENTAMQRRYQRKVFSSAIQVRNHTRS